MRFIRLAAAVAAITVAAPALANMGGGSSAPEPKPSNPSIPASAAATPRQQAERYYNDAYNDIAKAKKDIADKKDKNAEKRFKKALDRAQEAVTLDPKYHEAWNLVGYASRKLKNYDQAVTAYQTALGIQYDYAPAREYLGEAYLDMGKPDKAREQLAVLEKLKAVNEAAELKAAIELYAAAHPEAAGTTPAQASEGTNAAPASTGAAADTSGSKP
jgi:tetratricopeptide (TPR) repeat protein